jgi:hypothetical protein
MSQLHNIRLGSSLRTFSSPLLSIFCSHTRYYEPVQPQSAVKHVKNRSISLSHKTLLTKIRNVFGYITVLWTQACNVCPADKSTAKCTNQTCNWLMWDSTYLKSCWALYRPGEQTLGPSSGGLCVAMKTSVSEVYRAQQWWITVPAPEWSRAQSRPCTGLPCPQGPDSLPEVTFYELKYKSNRFFPENWWWWWWRWW